jgi:hypothetical protein
VLCSLWLLVSHKAGPVGMTMCYVVLIASLNSQEKAIHDIRSCTNRSQRDQMYLEATWWKARGPKEDPCFWVMSSRSERLEDDGPSTF